MIVFRKRFTLAAAAILLLIAQGCSQPIRNVADAPVVTASQSPSLQNVGEAIKRAGTGLGWGMAEQSPGKIVGTLNLRKHQATVEIAYDTKSYSIKYADSSNLKYDEKSGTIHKNYNGWIQNLNNAIRNNLASL